MELLKLALALLIAVQGANVPQDMKENAIQVALEAVKASGIEQNGEKRTVAENPAGSLAPAAPGAKEATPESILEFFFDPERGGFGKDGCWYARPKGQKAGGIKTWCPPAI